MLRTLAVAYELGLSRRSMVLRTVRMAGIVLEGLLVLQQYVGITYPTDLAKFSQRAGVGGNCRDCGVRVAAQVPELKL